MYLARQRILAAVHRRAADHSPASRFTRTLYAHDLASLQAVVLCHRVGDHDTGQLRILQAAASKSASVVVFTNVLFGGE